MNRSHASRFSLALTAVLLAAAPMASAADYYWTGATSGNWTTSTNWDTTPTFGTSADIFFSNPSAGNLSNFTGAATTVRSLNFTDNQSVTIRTTTTAAGTTAANLTFNGGGSGAFLNVAAGTIANHTVGTGGGGVVLADNLTVDHKGSGNVTINRVVSGSGFGITKTGIGTLVLNQQNTFTGGLTINEGRVRASGTNTATTDIGDGTVTLGGGTLEIANTAWANNKTYANSFVTTAATSSTIEYVNTSGTARNITFGTGTTTLNGDLLIKNMNTEAGNAFAYSQSISGAGKLIYEGNNDLSVNYSDRRLQISAANGGWSGGFELRKGGANFAGAAATISGTGAITLGETDGTAGAGLYFNPGQTNAVTTYANDIIVRSGTGLRSLRGVGGNATIDAGFLFAGNVTLEGTLNIDMQIIKTGGSSKNMQFSGNMSGAGGLDLTRSGTTGDYIGLGGTNTYTGNTTINSGVELRLTSATAIGDTSRVIIAAAHGAQALNVRGGDETIGSLEGGNSTTSVTLFDGATLTLGGNNFSTAYDGYFNESGTLLGKITKTGSGTFTLNNAGSSYTGATTINQGVLEVTSLGNGSAASTIGASTNAAANLVLNGGTLRFSGTAAGTTVTDRLFTVSANSTIDASGTGNSGALLRFTNTGDIAWGNPNEGRTLTLNAGTVGNNIIDSRITDNGAGAVAIVKDGTGNWQFTANNTYSGGTVINGGFLRIGASTSSGTVGSGQVTLNGGTLSSGRIDTFELNNLITGNGTVHMNNTGVMVLTNNNTYTGTTNVNFSGGTIQMGNGSTSGSIGTSNVFINTGGTFRINRSDEVLFSANMTGPGRFVQQGLGTTILTGANSYAGNTTISAGVLQIGNNGTTGTLGAGNVINDGILRFSRSNSLTANSVIQGGGSLEQVGAGTTILSANNTYTGATTISAGVLQIGNGGTTGSLSTSSVITNDGTLAFNRSDNIAQGTHFSGAAINGTGSLLKQGAGMLTLNTNNGYTGLTTISNGVVRIQDSNALGLGGFSGTTMSTIASGSALEIDGSLSLTEHIQVQGSGVGGTGAIRAISGSSSINMHVALMADTTIGVDSGANLNIGGGGYGLYFNGGLTKEGNGTLVLSGDNTYVGNTTVSNGTLLINGSTSSTSLVSVAVGATLGGNGTVGAATTVSGFLNPGNSPGVLTFDDSVTLLSTAVTTMEIDGINRGSDYDGINIVGDLTYGGTLTLDLGVLFGVGSHTFDLFDLGSEGLVDSELSAVTLAGLYSGSLTESFLGSGIWGLSSGSDTWTFTESTGDLNLVVIPEPRAALLGGLGLLMLIRRRRN